MKRLPGPVSRLQSDPRRDILIAKPFRLLLHLKVRLQASELILGEAYAYPPLSMDSMASDHQQVVCLMKVCTLWSDFVLLQTKARVTRCVPGAKQAFCSQDLFHNSGSWLEEAKLTMIST